MAGVVCRNTLQDWWRVQYLVHVQSVHNNMLIDQAGQRHVSARSGQSATGSTSDATRTLDLFNPKTFASMKSSSPSLSVFPILFRFSVLCRHSFTKLILLHQKGCLKVPLIALGGVLCPSVRPFSVVSTAFVVLSVTSLFTIMWTVEWVKHFNTINGFKFGGASPLCTTII
jgi:hypothetical protein